MSDLTKLERERSVCKILSHSRLTLCLTGFWPEEDVHKSVICIIKSYMVFLLYATMGLIQFIIMVKFYTDERALIMQILDAATMMVVNFRLFLFISNRSSILLLVNEAEQILMIDKNLEKLTVMTVWYSRQAKMIKWLSLVYVLVLVIWFFGIICSSGSGSIIGTNLPSYFYELPWFHLILTTEFVVTSIALLGLLTEDIFITFFIFHVCGELECIKVSIQNIERCKQSSSIRNTIESHVLALTYGSKVCQLLSTFLFLEMIPFMIGICVSALIIFLNINITMTTSALAVLFICILRVFIICMIGETLSQESFGIQEAVIKSDWYYFDTNDRKAIMLILRQSQKPLELRVGTFGIMNLKTFSAFIFNAFSYSTVLRTIIQREI